MGGALLGGSREVRVVRELQALDGRLALLGDVADDVCDGIRLVLEVAVGDVAELPARELDVALRGLER